MCKALCKALGYRDEEDTVLLAKSSHSTRGSDKFLTIIIQYNKRNIGIHGILWELRGETSNSAWEKLRKEAEYKRMKRR